MNKLYEMLILMAPGSTDTEISEVERHLQKLLKDASATLISFDKWGKCRLAYPVKHHEYGCYVLIRFEAEQTVTLFKEIGILFAVKYAEAILRHVIKRLCSKSPLTYQRPLSVEEAPVVEFVKEDKIDLSIEESSIEELA